MSDYDDRTDEHKNTTGARTKIDTRKTEESTTSDNAWEKDRKKNETWGNVRTDGINAFALTAVQFIRVVGAMLHPVTQVALWNARPVGTLSLVFKAACRRRENIIGLN